MKNTQTHAHKITRRNSERGAQGHNAIHNNLFKKKNDNCTIFT